MERCNHVLRCDAPTNERSTTHCCKHCCALFQQLQRYNVGHQRHCVGDLSARTSCVQHTMTRRHRSYCEFEARSGDLVCLRMSVPENPPANDASSSGCRRHRRSRSWASARRLDPSMLSGAPSVKHNTWAKGPAQAPRDASACHAEKHLQDRAPHRRKAAQVQLTPKPPAGSHDPEVTTTSGSTHPQPSITESPCDGINTRMPHLPTLPTMAAH